jgi:hypothetical protein
LVTAGDFNNDGKLDIAAAVTNNGNYPGFMAVLLGQGDGTFPTQLAYPTTQVPFAITAADFNKDGGLDLATANGSPTDAASVLLNYPVAAFLPSTLAFPKEKVGITSRAQSLTVSNPSVAPLRITSIAASGDFAQTNTCPVSPSTLASAASCPVTVTFDPTAEGKRTGAVTFKDNAASKSQSITVSGTGLAPVVSLTSNSLTYSTQLLNTTSASQTVTLTNTGNLTLAITSIVATGDFAQTNTCPSTLTVGANCTITITFTPTAVGTRTGAVTLTDNAPNSPQAITLTGTGTQVQLSSTSLDFGSEPVGVTSGTQTVTVTNVGAAMSISVSLTGTDPGDFSQTNTCGSSLGPGANCTISVTFTPTATGARSASVSITDTGGASPQTITLTGTGT